MQDTGIQVEREVRVSRMSAGLPDASVRKSIFLSKFEEYPQRSVAAKLCDVPISTVDSWVADDPVFKARYQEIRKNYLAGVGDTAETAVISGVSNPRNVWLALEVARQHHPDWKRLDPNNPLTQLNIETMVVNPHQVVASPQVGNNDTSRDAVDPPEGTGGDVPRVGHMGTGDTGERGDR